MTNTIFYDIIIMPTPQPFPLSTCTPTHFRVGTNYRVGEGMLSQLTREWLSTLAWSDSSQFESMTDP